MELTAEALIGAWRRDAHAACKTIYPPVVEFLKNGLYAAPDGPAVGAIWHGGDWEIYQNKALRVQAANDAMLSYAVDGLGAGQVVLVDSDGRRIPYSRAP